MTMGEARKKIRGCGARRSPDFSMNAAESERHVQQLPANSAFDKFPSASHFSEAVSSKPYVAPDCGYILPIQGR
jgi:hypothetical protein